MDNCPCGKPRNLAHVWHDTRNHDCIHHPKNACKICPVITEFYELLRKHREFEEYYRQRARGVSA